jgi:hypothetical protein
MLVGLAEDRFIEGMADFVGDRLIVDAHETC